MVTGRKQETVMADIKAQLTEGMREGTFKDEIAFFGGSFTCLPIEQQEEILALAQPYIRQGLVKGIRLSTRPDYIYPEILELLKRNGVTTIELGIQSTDDEVLKASGRGHTSRDIFKAARLVREYGFVLGLQMMIGLPRDTFEKSCQTASDIVDMKADLVRIYPTLVLHNSPLEMLYKSGEYSPLAIDEAVRQVSRLKMLFEYHNIKVIRTGLQANEGLDSGEGYLAGPYHPAFGELVDSNIYYLWLDYFIHSHVDQSAKSIAFLVHPSRLSKAIGQKKSNLHRLAAVYPDLQISIRPSLDVDSQEIQGVWKTESGSETVNKMSRMAFLAAGIR